MTGSDRVYTAEKLLVFVTPSSVNDVPVNRSLNLTTSLRRTGNVNAKIAAEMSEAITSVLNKYQTDAPTESDDDFVTPQRRKRK